MRTDWSKRTDPVAYQNLDETGQHTPGPDTAAVRFLVEERQVLGSARGDRHRRRPSLSPAATLSCHYYMHGSGRYGLQCLTNLDLLPPTGAVVIAARSRSRRAAAAAARARAGAEPKRAGARSQDCRPRPRSEQRLAVREEKRR
jgi:kynurenine formamidase